ncbi:hypothetical protein [Anatilimnocola aggregata]
MIDYDRLDLALLYLGIGRWCRSARQQVARLLTHDHLPTAGGEDRQQADF